MKISIISGFQRGGSLLSWDGEKFNRVQRASENTHVDDGDSSFTKEVADDFRGAVVKFWGISSLSYANSAELIGFTEMELNSPSPVKGWASCQGSCVRCTDDWQLITMGNYLTALARGASIFTIEQALQQGEKHPSGNGRILVRLAYEAGDQAARAYAVLDQVGNIVVEVSGCGDRTPKPVVTDDSWSFTSEEEEWMDKMHAEENRVLNAINRGDSEKWVKVLAHLRASYSEGCNPLPTLRRKYLGNWNFYRPGVWQGDVKDNAVIFLEIDRLEESSKGWTVVYTPAAK